MKVFYTKLFYLFLISFAYTYSMGMDLDQPVINSPINKAIAEMRLEEAIDNANLDWFYQKFPDLIKHHPTMLHGKFPYEKHKIDILAEIIVNAAQSAVNNNINKYVKYLDIYELLITEYKSNLLPLDIYSQNIINSLAKKDPKLDYDLNSIINHQRLGLKRPISEVDGSRVDQWPAKIQKK